MSRLNSRLIACVLIGSSACAWADPALQPPSGYYARVRVKAARSEPCEQVPRPYTAPLDFPSKYEGSDSARDALNPDSDARYRQLTQPITDLEKGFSKRVGRYMETGDVAQLDCAIRWIDTWAAAGALQGEAANHTAKSMRKWALASLSGAWLRLQFSSSAPLNRYRRETVRVETWLGEIATRVAREWSPGDRIDKINNHYYWAAWALMATAVVTNRRELFDQGLEIYRVFTRQVDAAGYLPNELARGSRAADYHDYAMLPLAMIAAFGKANGYSSGSALNRFAQRVQEALENPASFAAFAGVRQLPPDPNDKANWAWLEPYCWTVQCSSELLARRASLRPLGTTRLGGDLSALFSQAGVLPQPPTIRETRKP